MPGRETISPLFHNKNELNKSAEDYKTDFQTPPEVCKYMVSLIPAGTQTILEPSPGVGNMVRELKAKGFTKITYPSDFFLIDKRIRFDCIVMNPPFSTKFALMQNAPSDFDHQGMRLGYYFLTECMKMSNNVIALMPWFTISDSDVRLRALKDYGLKSITALPRRTFRFARIQTCVLELENRYQGATEFKVFDRLTESPQIKIEI
jgi:type I restriction-modification system DNA methylase subunit